MFLCSIYAFGAFESLLGSSPRRPLPRSARFVLPSLFRHLRFRRLLFQKECAT